MRLCRLIPLACTFSAAIACGGSEPQPIQSAAPEQSPPAISPIGPAAPAAATVIKVDADSPMTTPSGATYTVPKAWTVTTRSGVVILQDPDRNVSVTLVERKEFDGTAAIAAAWEQVKPDFSRKVKLEAAPPGRGGWDAAMDIDYETLAQEAREIWARARRKGDTWYVSLFDGTTEGRRRYWAGLIIRHWAVYGTLLGRRLLRDSFGQGVARRSLKR